MRADVANRTDDPEVEVLKLHHYLGPDVNTAVIDAVLEALVINNNCQALYIQNFNEGFRDEQVCLRDFYVRHFVYVCVHDFMCLSTDLCASFHYLRVSFQDLCVSSLVYGLGGCVLYTL